jgi:hypothetical protein
MKELEGKKVYLRPTGNNTRREIIELQVIYPECQGIYSFPRMVPLSFCVLEK